MYALMLPPFSAHLPRLGTLTVVDLLVLLARGTVFLALHQDHLWCSQKDFVLVMLTVSKLSAMFCFWEKAAT